MPGLPRPSDRSDLAERACLVALSLVKGLGPARLSYLVSLCGSAQGAWTAPDATLERAGLPEGVLLALLDHRRGRDPFREIQALRDEGLEIVTSLDEDYPRGLRSVADSPAVLYVRGEPRLLPLPAVAVVGTRRPTHYGLDVTGDLAGGLAARGVVVVSGLALGIDAAAHRAAIQAGGKTIGVLGAGIRSIYPAGHAGLARVMTCSGGAVISQFRPDTLPRRGSFIARNRVVAAMVQGVVVTEAPEGSGALSTAGWAREFGRVVMAVPGPVSSRTYDGCLGLLRTGAIAVAGAEHVMAAIGLAEPAGEVRGLLSPASALDRPPDEATGVMSALGAGEIAPFAVLLSRTGLGAERLGALLGQLEVGGWVRRQPGQCYVRTKSPRP
jgi:DNA processing protein